MLCLRQILFHFPFKFRTILLVFVPVCSHICDPIDDSCRQFLVVVFLKTYLTWCFFVITGPLTSLVREDYLSRGSCCLNKQLEEGRWSKWWACGLWFWELKFAYFEVLSRLGCISWTGLLWLFVVELTTRTNKEAKSPPLNLVKFGSIGTSRLLFPFLGIVLCKFRIEIL